MSEPNLLGFKPPDDFPIESYHAIRQCLNKYANINKAQVSLFRLGWNGLGYRYRAMVEYDKEFTESICRSKISPSHEELYEQSKNLFGFIENAVSVIECFFFASYCLSSILKPSELPLSKDDELRVSNKKVYSYFAKYFTGDKFTLKLNECLDADKYK